MKKVLSQTFLTLKRYTLLSSLYMINMFKKNQPLSTHTTDSRS